jgi:hypothetical protein
MRLKRSAASRESSLKLDQWLEDSEAPVTTPGESGEWRLNPLRWHLLRAALRNPPSPRLHTLVPLVEQAFAAAGLDGPAPLAPEHRVDGFDCGVELLNEGLRKSVARRAAGVEAPSRTWVVASGNEVVGYYSLRPVVALCDEHPFERIPLVFVARTALDQGWRRAGVAERLVIALMRSAWTFSDHTRPAGAFALTLNASVRRLFRRMGVRPLGDAIDARGIFTPATDLAAVAEAGFNP